MSGLIFTFVAGVLFILLSLLIKAKPQLVANSDSLAEASEMSKVVATKNVSDAFMIGGIIVLCLGVGALLLKKDIPGVSTLLVSVIVPAYIFVRNRTLLKPISKTLLSIVFCTVLLISGLIIYSDRTSKIEIAGKDMKISGLHGGAIPLKAINRVELLSKIPPIKSRSSGYSRGSIKKGYFKLKGWGVCKLLVETEQAPFLLILLNDDEHIVLNWRDETFAQQYYAELKELL